jgi:hypothetical protein
VPEPCAAERAPTAPCAEFEIVFREQPTNGHLQTQRLCATSAAAAAVWVCAILRLLSQRACAALIGEAHDDVALSAGDDVLHEPGSSSGSCGAFGGGAGGGAACATGVGAGSGAGGCGADEGSMRSEGADSSWELVAVDEDTEHPHA